MTAISRKLKEKLRFKNIKYANENHLKVFNDKTQNFSHENENIKLNIFHENSSNIQSLCKHLSIFKTILSS